MKGGWILIALLTSASGAVAQDVVRETPHGQKLTAPIGGVVWEKSGFNGTPGVVISSPVYAAFSFNHAVALPAGTALQIIREKKLKACRVRTTTELGGYSFGGWADCLIDTNGDGKFDRISVNEVAGGKDIAPPISYSREQVPIMGTGGVSFRRTLTFLGVGADTIRLSYREFANDTARPAFTEDLTLPVPDAYPQTVTVKAVKLTFLKIGPDGLSYSID